MGKSIKVTVRIEPPLMAQIEDCLAAERGRGREITTAAFIRMAIRRAAAEEQLKRDPEN